ncbi:MAG: hypothetical protein F6K37_11780 [Moorea sp. SIO4E2]|uniref:hypothetical protein n=1 Tax=Moorena sp. SIO4E2 TaxID=2607826 RepID=UPI0013B7908C|nr:hypothetical protein [Moorena sp. SIO4E2]NEQ06586.1 hypothetical protein [Moorena sp. SIO4E2]
MNSQFSRFNGKPSAISVSRISYQHSAISYQHSAISIQLSAISYQLMGYHRLEACATTLLDRCF